jgi:hypothetical protein
LTTLHGIAKQCACLDPMIYGLLARRPQSLNVFWAIRFHSFDDGRIGCSLWESEDVEVDSMHIQCRDLHVQP